jgi:hypothetical protein
MKNNSLVDLFSTGFEIDKKIRVLLQTKEKVNTIGA